MNTQHDLSAEARSAKVDHLDDAIDAVAARMTRVEENDVLAAQIINALPERSIWSGWLFQSWAPRLAITAALAIGAALVVLRTFDDRSTEVLRTFDSRSTDVQFAVAVAEHRTEVEPPLIVRRTIVEPPSNDRRTLDVPDHERSLPALGAVTALAFDSLAPVSLPEDAPLTLEPLAIAELPLTADSFSPR